MAAPLAPSAAPAPEAPPRRPGRVAIWVGLVLIAVGIVGGTVLVAVGARSVVTGVDDLQRVPASGGTVELDAGGSIEVYGERDVAASAPKTFSSSSTSGPVPEIQLAITDPSGETVVVEPVAGSQEYQYGGHWGTRIGRIQAPESGTYTVEVVGGIDAGRYDTIALGDRVRPTGLWLVVGGVLGGVLLVLVGGIVAIVGAVIRSRAKRRGAAGPVPPGASGPAGGWVPPPGSPPVAPPPPSGPTRF